MKEASKTSSPPLSASTLITPLPCLLLKQPPPIILNNCIFLGEENRNPMLKKKAESLRIRLLLNVGTDGGNDDVVPRGEVVAIMEQGM